MGGVIIEPLIRFVSLAVLVCGGVTAALAGWVCTGDLRVSADPARVSQGGGACGIACVAGIFGANGKVTVADAHIYGAVHRRLAGIAYKSK